MAVHLINRSVSRYVPVISLLLVVLLQGCASKLEDVTNTDAPTMEAVYNNYTGVDPQQLAARQQELLQRPAVVEPDIQLGHPPYPENLEHLYPRLPNPDLFMYVRPKAVGVSGVPIPAYITRFSMYERQPYALPGETLDTLKSVTEYRQRVKQEQLIAAEKNAKEVTQKQSSKNKQRGR